MAAMIYTVCVAAMLLLAHGAVLAVVLFASSWFAYRDITLLPSQPIREAIVQADATAPPGVPIVVAFLTAEDSARVYHDQAIRHQLIAAAGPSGFLRAEQSVAGVRRPWVILSYEYMVSDTSPSF